MMDSSVYRLKLRTRDLLKKMGFLSIPRFLRDRFTHREYRKWFLQFKQQYGEVLGYSLNKKDHKGKKVLVVNTGWSMDVAILGLIKALEIAGYEPVVLLKKEHRHLLEYYKLAMIKEIIFWNEFGKSPNLLMAEFVIERSQSIDQILAFEYAGVRAGRFATSTILRHFRLASLDVNSAKDRRLLMEYLASSMTAAGEADRLLQHISPELVLLSDPVYSPDGELFDNCLAKGIEVISVEAAHKSNALMLKRYSLETRDEHYASISEESWRLLRAMEWTGVHREQLQREIHETYSSGDWYSVAWSASSNINMMNADEIRKRLGLDPAKKTAFIFPHILWDASLSWGKNLFYSYEDWFIQAVKAACINDKVNWIIRIHPANVGKSLLDGFHGESTEVNVIRKHFDSLPPHVFLIPAESDISTWSLYGSMDYCLTVRGTVGIEAASFGIPVLTAGTGRYDRKGFTIDSDSREEYLGRLAHIQEIPKLTPSQKELAERYAYGLFILRPFPLETVTVDIHEGSIRGVGFNKARINIQRKEDWYEASDLRAFVEWVESSKRADFLISPQAEEQIFNLRDNPYV